MIRIGLLLMLLLGMACVNNSNGKLPPKAIEGVLDLRNWDFTISGSVELNGEWEFYWKQFLSPNISNHPTVKAPQSELLNKEQNSTLSPIQMDGQKATLSGYIAVPNVWNDFKVDSQPINGVGFGSYRLKVLLPESASNSKLALRFFDIGTAYSVYLNNELLSKVGNPATTPEATQSAYRPQVIEISTTHNILDILFHIANFQDTKGGLWNVVKLGVNTELTQERDYSLSLDLFLTGSLLLMGLYHLGLFSLRRKDSSTLYFGFFCLLLSLRNLLTGDFFFFKMFPDFSWALGVKLAYLTFYIGPLLFLQYVQEIFPAEMPRRFKNILISTATILALAVIALPPIYFTETLLTMEVIILFCVCIVIYTMVLAIYRKRQGAKSFFSGFIVFAPIILNDILHNQGIIKTGYFVPFGFLFFIFAQAFFLSMRFSLAFNQVEELTNNLEQKVEIRTQELQQQKQVAEHAQKLAEREHEKSEKLLLNILPKDVAEELKEKGFAEPVLFSMASVMFTDFKGFTQIAEKLSPQELLKDLDACFAQFDKITEHYNLEKLKTIGDSYMCAGGIPRPNKTHAIDCILAALEIQSFMNMMKEMKTEMGFSYWELRLGIHSGPLVAGVIGEKKFAYDVWGDTVNTASRMESSGTPGRINISGVTYGLVKDFFKCEYRGKVNAKNKGEVEMYYVHRLLPEFSKDELGLFPNNDFKKLYKNKR